jgi:hypothetical protein
MAAADAGAGALTWKPLRDGVEIGGRGGISFYRLHRILVVTELTCQLIGGLQGTRRFPGPDAAKAYAEIDFADWLKRVGLALP